MQSSPKTSQSSANEPNDLNNKVRTKPISNFIGEDSERHDLREFEEEYTIETTNDEATDLAVQKEEDNKKKVYELEKDNPETIKDNINKGFIFENPSSFTLQEKEKDKDKTNNIDNNFTFKGASPKEKPEKSNFIRYKRKNVNFSKKVESQEQALYKQKATNTENFIEKKTKPSTSSYLMGTISSYLNSINITNLRYELQVQNSPIEFNDKHNITDIVFDKKDIQFHYKDKINLHRMQGEIKTPNILKNMKKWSSVPEFSVIIGKNGVGKSQLLDYIHNVLCPNLNKSVLYLGCDFTSKDYNSWAYKKDNNFIKYDDKDMEDYLSKPFNLLSFIFTKYKEIADEQKRIETSETPPWKEINNIIAKYKQNLNIEILNKKNQYGFYEWHFVNTKGDDVKFDQLSSGQAMIISMISWKYAIENRSTLDKDNKFDNKVKYMLLDEPDRHLDPSLIKIFLDIIKECFVKQNIQVIMTTHRIDTVALTEDKNLFAIEHKEGQYSQIKQCNKLLALIKLSKNIQAFTGMHTKVYTEAFEDTEYYEALYANMLKYSNVIRENYKDITKEDGFIQELAALSHRYRMGFYSVSDKKGESGGHTSVRTLVNRGCNQFSIDTVYNKGNNHPHFSNTNSYLYNIFRAYQVDAPFGIVDKDYERSQTEDKDIEYKIQKTNRHSLENFMFDPIILCSLFKDKNEINKLVKDERLRTEFINLYESFNSKELFKIKEALNKLYPIIFEICLNYGEIEGFKKIILKPKIFDLLKTKHFGVEDATIKEYTDKIIKEINHDFIKITLREKEEALNSKGRQKPKYSAKLELDSKKFKIGITNIHDIIDEHYNINHKNNQNYIHNLKEVTEIFKTLNDAKSNGFETIATSKIKYFAVYETDLEKLEIKLLEIDYPDVLRNLLGHILEHALSDYLDRNFKSWITERISEISLTSEKYMLIPYDLAETIFNLNYKVKHQIISKIDSSRIRNDGSIVSGRYTSYIANEINRRIDLGPSTNKSKISKKIYINTLKDLVVKEHSESEEQLSKRVSNSEDIYSNAFNQFANQEYWYQQKDALFIGKEIQKQLTAKLDTSKLVFQEALGGLDANGAKENAIRTIKVYVQGQIKDKAPSEKKALVGIYNVGLNHWIAYAIEPKINGDVVISYKDSKGNKQNNFENVMSEAVKAILPEAVISIIPLDSGKIDQLDSAACCIFAFKNMEMIIEAITEGSALSTITNYYNSTHNQDQIIHDEIIKAGRKEYAILYVEAVKENIIHQLTETLTKEEICKKLNVEKEKFIPEFKTKIAKLEELHLTVCKLDSESEVEIRIVNEADEKQDKAKLGAYTYDIKIKINQEQLIYEDNILTDDINSDLKNKIIESLGGNKEDYCFRTERDSKVIDNKAYVIVKIANKIVEGKETNNMDLPKSNRIIPDHHIISIKLQDALYFNKIPHNLQIEAKNLIKQLEISEEIDDSNIPALEPIMDNNASKTFASIKPIKNEKTENLWVDKINRHQRTHSI